MKYRKLIGNCMHKKSDDNLKVALALVAGIAVGAIVSVLFAPNKGENTREKIADKAKDLQYGIKDKYNLLREKVFGVDAIEEDIENEVPHFVHKNVKKAKSDIKNVVEETKEKLHDAQSEVESKAEDVKDEVKKNS
ncbi:gas vesicle protein [Pedobacter sp. UYP30]|uniref:YtxH domain-containing protein n=1 Tax=Pedobacter sp. UYP30 TaxID=1756400 RepID=UPI003398E38C